MGTIKQWNLVIVPFAHSPSSVKIPSPGEWAVLLYTNGKYFGTLIDDIQK